MKVNRQQWFLVITQRWGLSLGSLGMLDLTALCRHLALAELVLCWISYENNVLANVLWLSGKKILRGFCVRAIITWNKEKWKTFLFNVKGLIGLIPNATKEKVG